MPFKDGQLSPCQCFLGFSTLGLGLMGATGGFDIKKTLSSAHMTSGSYWPSSVYALFGCRSSTLTSESLVASMDPVKSPNTTSRVPYAHNPWPYCKHDTGNHRGTKVSKGMPWMYKYPWFLDRSRSPNILSPSWLPPSWIAFSLEIHGNCDEYFLLSPYCLPHVVKFKHGK